MRIQLQKFGTLLSSRPAGKDAYAGFAPILATRAPDESIEVDFSGVSVLAPSWADEFLTPLQRQFGEYLVLLPSTNPSVMLTLELLEESNGYVFKRES